MNFKYVSEKGVNLYEYKRVFSIVLTTHLKNMLVHCLQNNRIGQTVYLNCNWSDFQKRMNTASLKDLKIAEEHLRRKYLILNQLYQSRLHQDIERDIVFKNSCLIVLHLFCCFEYWSAIRARDMGRLHNVLKQWIVWFHAPSAREKN